MTPPKHIGIIMDGNRRWAKSLGKTTFEGHTEGAKNIRNILEEATDQGIEYITLWALSTENIKNRSTLELEGLYTLISKLPEYISESNSNNIRINIIGNMSLL
ncbi:undecaprenyl diphosphate synthase family protein, partial [Candidatus Gracilibacteria bacterium]|nr:undecaprenyl diphosphate synthase family protein [Candidatus Gracilibacteria bacterium]